MKKGIVEQGLVIALAIAVGSVVSMTKFYFTGGPGDTASSAALTAATALTVYSQMPHVKDNFRRKKAVGMCEDEGGIHCQEMVDGMVDEDVLAYIKDDKVPLQINNYGYITRKDTDIRFASN